MIKTMILLESNDVMSEMTKYTLILSFDPDKSDFIIKEANDRLNELETKELIEDITITENEATIECVFFSSNKSVSENSLRKSFTGIHDSMDARIFSERLNDKAPSQEKAIKNRISPLSINLSHKNK